jgi:hypothetical protein
LGCSTGSLLSLLFLKQSLLERNFEKCDQDSSTKGSNT